MLPGPDAPARYARPIWRTVPLSAVPGLSGVRRCCSEFRVPHGVSTDRARPQTSASWLESALVYNDNPSDYTYTFDAYSSIVRALNAGGLQCRDEARKSRVHTYNGSFSAKGKLSVVSAPASPYPLTTPQTKTYYAAAYTARTPTRCATDSSQQRAVLVRVKRWHLRNLLGPAGPVLSEYVRTPQVRF